MFYSLKPIASFYQFCNGIQLNRVLPPGPRDYWAELAAEHKKAPSHQSWMYDDDPFAAQKSVADRQERAVKKIEAQETGEAPAHDSKSNPFDDSPEVKLSSELRGLVENAIKLVFIFNPLFCTHTYPCVRGWKTAQKMGTRLLLLFLRIVCQSSSNSWKS
jgi:hypothetical protein